MSTMIDMIKNVDKEVAEVLDQKHKCENMYNEIIEKKKELELLAETYNKELLKYKKMLRLQ